MQSVIYYQMHPFKTSVLYSMFFFLVAQCPSYISMVGLHIITFFFEMSYVETSNATSPTLLVTERSRNSTTILSNTTNTVSSENSYCGIVFVITCFCFAVVLMIAIGIWHVRKRQIMKTREGQESIESIETDSLFPPNFMRNCNWTKIYKNDYYHNVIQSELRGYMTRWTAMFEKEYCFGFFVFQADIYQE